MKQVKSATKIAGVEITHPDRILFPKSKITKLQIAKYYQAISDKILPALTNRQISLVRSPGGLNSGKFYQKHPSENFPDYIQRIKIQEKEGPDVYIQIDALEDVIYLVNIGVLEFHVGNSKISDYETPDRIIFDLDPGENVNNDVLVRGAYILKYLLDGLKLHNTIKTSGGKGYHIIAELDKKYSWKDSKDLSKKIAESVVEHYPNAFTISIKKEDRRGKVFIDYLRNDRGNSTVASYSTRAREGAPISLPIDWADLPNIKPDQFSILNFV
jgi:bifunctional non-homologous end joining protein LigD